MPELPEVETVACGLRGRIVGRAIEGVETSGLALRRPVDARRLGRACVHHRFERIERIAKYLLLHVSSGNVVLAHLGMSGRLLFADGEPRPAHTHVVFRFGGGRELRFVDPRRFGIVTVGPAADVGGWPELARLGVDPLGDDFTRERLAAELGRSRREIKQLLLDQTRVAGLGNIYVCEALHEAGISPRRRSDRLGRARIDRLHAAIPAVLRRSIDHRGTSLRDYVDADGWSGENQHYLAAYGREGEPCRCGTAIRRVVQGGRSTFYCPRCQR